MQVWVAAYVGLTCEILSLDVSAVVCKKPLDYWNTKIECKWTFEIGLIRTDLLSCDPVYIIYFMSGIIN